MAIASRAGNALLMSGGGRDAWQMTLHILSTPHSPQTFWGPRTISGGQLIGAAEVLQGRLDFDPVRWEGHLWQQVNDRRVLKRFNLLVDVALVTPGEGRGRYAGMSALRCHRSLSFGAESRAYYELLAPGDVSRGVAPLPGMASPHAQSHRVVEVS